MRQRKRNQVSVRSLIATQGTSPFGPAESQSSSMKKLAWV
jgi:hypothetical protein